MRTRTRFSLLIIVLVAGFAGATIKSEDALLREHLKSGQEEWLGTLVRAVAEAASYDVINEDPAHAQFLLKSIASGDEAIEYIFITDFDQHLFAHTFDGGFPVEMASKTHMTGSTKPKSLLVGQNQIAEHSTPLIDGMDAYLHIGVNQSEINALIAKSQADLIPLIVISMAVSLVIALFIANRISEPLRTLSSQIALYGNTGIVPKLNKDISEPDVQKLAIAFDETIAAREKIDHELREAIEIAERANASKSEFLAAMSHELRTPLNAILGFSEIMSLQLLGPLGVERYKEYAGDIHDSAGHLQLLINDVLDLSAIEAGKLTMNKERFSVNELCEEGVKLLAIQVTEGNITSKVVLDETLPNIFADKRAIKQIIINLLHNAVKFTPKGGVITLTTSRSKLGIKISVADTGKGISDEMLSKLTTPFTKGEDDPLRTSKGWGLGLAICKSLVELHDGLMTFKSDTGKGTIVTVNLPTQSG